MDTQMTINGNKVRTLREEKSWSQEHLANASGLSARTVQRVESAGVGSAETRLALAAVLGVPVSALMAEPMPPIAADTESRRLPFWGWLGWGFGALSFIGLIAYGYDADNLPMKYMVLNLVPWLALTGMCAGAVAIAIKWRRSRAIAA
jgi:transcriptional regulator with XRE-family HTH domain